MPFDGATERELGNLLGHAEMTVDTALDPAIFENLTSLHPPSPWSTLSPPAMAALWAHISQWVQTDITALESPKEGFEIGYISGFLHAMEYAETFGNI